MNKISRKKTNNLYVYLMRLLYVFLNSIFINSLMCGLKLEKALSISFLSLQRKEFCVKPFVYLTIIYI